MHNVHVGTWADMHMPGAMGGESHEQAHGHGNFSQEWPGLVQLCITRAASNPSKRQAYSAAGYM